MTTFSTNILRSESFDLVNPEIKIESRWSDVVVMESPDPQCHIEIVGEGSDSQEFAEMANIAQSGNRIKIQIDKRKGGIKEFFNRGSSNLTLFIKVPVSAEVKIESVSADVTVEQSLKSAHFTTVSGDLTINKSPIGKSSITSVSGDVTAHVSTAGDFSFKTVSGDIKVFVTPGFEVEVDSNTVSGDLRSEIELSSQPGSASVHSNSNGEVVRIKVNTVSGDFSLARS